MRAFEHADHVPFLELHSFALGLGISQKNSQLPPNRHLDKAIQNERNKSAPPPKTRSLPFPPPKTPARKNLTQYVSWLLRGTGGGGGRSLEKQQKESGGECGTTYTKPEYSDPTKDTHHHILLPFPYPGHI
jgi:hypothetical protein